MDYLKPRFFLSMLLLAFASPSLCKAPVWKVSKDDNYLYIGGTIHVLSKDDYPLPNAFESAFNDTARLVFETDIAALSLPENQIKLSAALQFQDSRTLKTELNPETYTRLTNYLSNRNIPIENFTKYTPGGMSIVLTALELQVLEITAAGVDEHFSSRADHAFKQTGFLESIDEQLGFIEEFSTLDPNKLVNSSLSDLENLKTEWQKLLDSWRHGDVDTLDEIALEEMQNEFPKLYQFILVERNTRWLEKIKLMLSTQEIEFILVGALHLAGTDSVLIQLADLGYTIEQLD